MSTPIDRGLLRDAAGQVGLSRFDMDTLKGLVARGGETGWYPQSGNKSERFFTAVQSMIDRGLVIIIERPLVGQFMRLTDKGRNVAAQLEAMDVAPKIQVVGQ